MQQRSRNEAVEVNRRECRRRRTGNHGGLGGRKGGAGKRKVATPVTTSSCEDELMKDIGVPQCTWGDGSCWLWAVAGAMGKLEGTTCPTEKDVDQNSVPSIGYATSSSRARPSQREW
eukprot:6183266-Pleurochrysis_carterae.AAC.1